MATRPLIRISQMRLCHASAANAGSHFGNPNGNPAKRIDAGALVASYLHSSTSRSVEMVEKFRLSVSSVLQSMRREQEAEPQKMEEETTSHAALSSAPIISTDLPVTQSIATASSIDIKSEEAPKSISNTDTEPFSSQRWLQGRERDHLEKRLFMGIDLSSEDFPDPEAPPVKAESGKWRSMASQLVQQAASVAVAAGSASKQRLSSFQWSKHATATAEDMETPPDVQGTSLTHVSSDGKARMVDVGQKIITHRTAIAEGSVMVGKQIMQLLRENLLKKGDALTTAQIAGVMAAKRTSELIPLCHNIVLNDIQVQLRLDEARNSVQIRSAVRCDGRTGAEMEALTAVTVAALTVYDMCKAVSKDMTIGEIRLVKKTGGKSDYSVDNAMIEE